MPEPNRHSLCVVVVNYRTPELVVDCLRSLEGELESHDAVVVVDNCSGDGSDEHIEAALAAHGWTDWARLVRSPTNGGFSAGNNVGLRAVDADLYLLLNSDTIVRPGAIAALRAAAAADPGAGILGPRLEWPDGTPQVSRFRNHTVLSEFLSAAGTGVITRLFGNYRVAIEIDERVAEVEWTTFACALIRREVIERVGPLDEGYFMYFEDCDYCRATRAAGFRIAHVPEARVVHLRGGTSEVKRKVAARERPPRYLYASRTRYFRKAGGRRLAILANVAWSAGRTVALTRELLGNKAPGACERQWLDNWTDALRP